MGLSETILAAMIGAGATVGTALFQILTAFKAKGRLDVKPKKGTTMRSIFAVLALMVASAAGGFLYSQFLQQRAGEDIRAMRQELRELRDLTASRVLERNQPRQQLADSAAIGDPGLADRDAIEPSAAQAAVASMGLEPASGVAESIAYVPACRGTAAAASEVPPQCEEADAQRLALCGTIPAHATVSAIQLFAQPDAVQHPWEQHAVSLESDLGGARFTGKTFEYAQGQNAKAVCVNFLHWSSQHPHIARIVVQYGFSGEEVSPAAAPPAASAPVLTQTTVMGETLQAASPASAFSSPATALR